MNTEEDDRITFSVDNVGDGWWQFDGETGEFHDMTDIDGNVWEILGYEYLSMTEFSPLTCKSCNQMFDEGQLLLRLEGGWWVIPHSACMGFVWYRERRVLE